MRDSLVSGKSLGIGRSGVQAKAMVLTICFTLIISPIITPVRPGMAQVTVDQVLSLKEVPVPVPTAAVIPVVTPGVNPIPGPGTDLNFQDLTVEIVKDQAALVRLGKALFWDMQVGSDGVQACATCHFNAGADVRSVNSISPGIKDANFHGPLTGDSIFGNSTVPYTANDPNFFGGIIEPPDPQYNAAGFPQFKPNYKLQSTDFPLNTWVPPTDFVPRGPGVTIFEELVNVTRDTNDVISSQGVRHTLFVGVQPGSAVDIGTPAADIWNTVTPGQLNLKDRTRRVEPRNAPTVINAVFNYDNFWDGRASYVFNGVNPFGFRDQASTLKKNVGVTMQDVFIRVINSSLASQAVGPPGSNFEMSFEGRSFPDIGKKMVSLRPLAKQLVHPQDSILGGLSRAKLKPNGTLSGDEGLNVATYTDMIKAAFQNPWWDSTDIITVDTATQLVQKPTRANPRKVVLRPGRASVSRTKKGTTPALASNQYTQMQYNFSLFFGLAVQAYEATLISDDTPFDRFMGAPSLGIPADPFALNDQQRLGFSIFMDADPINGARCANCHVPPVTTGHTVIDFQPDAQGVPNPFTTTVMEIMLMGDFNEANYDHGMYNISVRRTSEDVGRGGGSPFTNPLTGAPFPLSLVELAYLRQYQQLPDDLARFVPDVPILDRRVVNGCFKAPNLRNTRYTGPYFHNGDSATLRQVVEFYVRGGNFPNTNMQDFDVDIFGIPTMVFPEFNPAALTNIQALVAFVAEALTDDRVAYERAPFDHPQLMVPDGGPAKTPEKDTFKEIPAVGKNGRAKPIPTFLNLDPQQP